MSVNELKIGQKACIYNVCGDRKFAKRLCALGYTKGCTVEVINKAPLGDPIVLSLRGCKMAIRKRDANNITVEAI